MTEASAELAKYGATGIAIALVAAMVYIIIKFLDQQNKTARTRDSQDTRFIKTQDKLQKAIDRNSKCIEKNTQVAAETYDFLKTLNGDLKAVVHKKARGK